MSITLQTELWVEVQQFPGNHAPRPLPLESGFSEGTLYRVLGIHSASETSECYFILCNDRREVWFVSNRHFRVAQAERFHRAAGSPLVKDSHPADVRRAEFRWERGPESTAAKVSSPVGEGTHRIRW